MLGAEVLPSNDATVSAIREQAAQRAAAAAAKQEEEQKRKEEELRAREAREKKMQQEEELAKKLRRQIQQEEQERKEKQRAKQQGRDVSTTQNKKPTKQSANTGVTPLSGSSELPEEQDVKSEGAQFDFSRSASSSTAPKKSNRRHNFTSSSTMIQFPPTTPRPQPRTADDAATSSSSGFGRSHFPQSADGRHFESLSRSASLRDIRKAITSSDDSTNPFGTAPSPTGQLEDGIFPQRSPSCQVETNPFTDTPPSDDETNPFASASDDEGDTESSVLGRNPFAPSQSFCDAESSPLHMNRALRRTSSSIRKLLRTNSPITIEDVRQNLDYFSAHIFSFKDEQPLAVAQAFRVDKSKEIEER